MASRIKLVQGDSAPQIIVSMTDDATGAPINVSTANVTMKFRQSGSTEVLNILSATLLTGRLSDDGTIDQTYTTPGSGGRVAFAWPPGALDVEPGYYEGEIQIIFADGTVQTVYQLLKFSVRAEF